MLKRVPGRAFSDISPELNELSGKIVDAAYKVHFALGPGLLESIYQLFLFHKITKIGLAAEKEVPFPIQFEGLRLDSGLRLDLLVEGKIVVEIKSVDSLKPLHEAQLMTYLKLTGLELGLLINFNVPLLKDGIKRIALSRIER